MEKILIGSSLFRVQSIDTSTLKRKLGTDIDYAVNDKSLAGRFGNVEYLYNPVLFEPHMYKKKAGDEIVLTPLGLRILKMSHVLGWNIKDNKHIDDLIFLTKYTPIKEMTSHEKNLLMKLMDFWTTVHGPPFKRSDLDMSGSEFFNNAVGFPIDHDHIHEVLAKHPSLFGKPMYLKVLKDGAEVDVSEEKFNKLTHAEKISLVQEEVMVMAYERNFHNNYKINYFKMLIKFIKHHAPLWEAIYILWNLYEFIHAPFNFKQYLDDNLRHS